MCMHGSLPAHCGSSKLGPGGERRGAFCGWVELRVLQLAALAPALASGQIESFLSVSGFLTIDLVRATGAA